MATSKLHKNAASNGSKMRYSSTIRRRIVRVNGGSYPFVSETTTFLKRTPPAACRVTPPSTMLSTMAFSYLRKTGSGNTGLLLNVDWNMTLPDRADDAMLLLVMPCALFMWAFQPDALVDPEYHLRHTMHWRFPQCLAELPSCQSLTYSHGNWCFWRFHFDLATECIIACMSPSLLSDATTTIVSPAMTTLTARSPLLDIVLCSSLNAAAKDRGGVDFMTDSSLSRKNK